MCRRRGRVPAPTRESRAPRGSGGRRRRTLPGPRRGGAGRLPPHIDAEEGGPTAGRPDQVGHDLDGRGLARSIRTEEAKGGPLRDRQVEGLEGGEVTVLLAEALEVNGGIVCGRLFDDGFHRIAIYRDILKSLVNSCAAWTPSNGCEGVFVAGTRRSERGRETFVWVFRARPSRRVAGALKPRDKVSHLWLRSSRR